MQTQLVVVFFYTNEGGWYYIVKLIDTTLRLRNYLRYTLTINNRTRLH